MESKPSFIPFGHMLPDYYVARVRALAEERRQQRDSVRTRAQAEALVRDVRRRLQRCFGAFPERTPLRPRVAGVLERNGYRVEKVLFESRPGFPVTANLYLPADLRGPAPGVIGPCGHSSNGKAADTYQRFCQSLARKGFVVLMYDPLGQGERKQLEDLPGSELARGPCNEHNMLGNAMQLCGDFLGTWRVWDGIRALDYLLTRPEVDPARVGVTGNSGGGTLSSYLNALDARYTMAAPSCFVTRYARNIENELPQDSEQNPPGFLGAGLEMADFFIARAPRPVLLLGQRDDFFDHRGLTETFEDVRRIYRLLGAAGEVARFIGPDNHGYHRANREAMYGFFCAKAGLRAGTAEPEDLQIEAEADLNCTAGGQVVLEPGGCRRVFEFTGEAAVALRRGRGRPQPASLAVLAGRMLGVRAGRSVPYARILRHEHLPASCSYMNRYAVEVEPGIVALLLRPSARPVGHLEGAGAARLYAPHAGTRADMQRGLFPASGDPALPLFSLDGRGQGESIPLLYNIPEDENAAYGADFFYACCGSLLGEPLLGGTVRDLLAAIRLLRGAGYSEIQLEGCGRGAIRAAFAALLAGDAVASVRLRHALLSYEELACAALNRWPFSVMLPGVLRAFDLPDVYRALGSRLTLEDPWNADAEPWPADEARLQARKLGIPARLLRFSASGPAAQ